MPDLAGLAACARALLPPGTGIGATDPRDRHPAFPGEDIAGVPLRLAEFRAGRAAARAAMAELGLPTFAVPVKDDRAPRWPAGLCGSISHSETLCLAAVAVLSPLRGIGLDLEEDGPLEEDLRTAILRPEENHVSAEEAMLIFSAKEAAYKAQYPMSLCLFGFDALSVSLDHANRSFTARFTTEITPFPMGYVLHGRYAHVQGHILTAVTL